MRNYKSDHEKLSHFPAKGLHFQGGKDTCVEGHFRKSQGESGGKEKEEAKMQREKENDERDRTEHRDK